MKARLLLAMLTAAVAAPVAADDPIALDLAISRLRGCVIAASGSAPGDDLALSVATVRSLCHPRLKAAYEASDRQVAADNPDVRGKALEALREQARRKINFDLGLAVSTQTGAQP